MICQRKKKKLIDFIFSKEKIEGGFSFTRSTPPTIEDTYFALRLLKELGENYVNKKTQEYIKKININEKTGLKQLYRLVYLYDFYSLYGNKLVVRNYFSSSVFNYDIDKISDIYYIVMIKELLKMGIELNQKVIGFLTGVTPEKLGYISECAQYVITMNKLRLPFVKERFIQWVRDAQNPDGCFGFTLKTTSFLENTYHALRALKVLGSKPRNMENCERFIYSCLTKSGGFGRQSNTVPTLEYSYYAIVNLKILDEMKKKFMKNIIF
ncbi:MAG: hypothetical protein FE039_00435 [Thermoplasmata archaeon]|nr:MAG: hypothetical protein FE039_00435 [Thermoplasmata archaeon]